MRYLASRVYRAFDASSTTVSSMECWNGLGKTAGVTQGLEPRGDVAYCPQSGPAKSAIFRRTRRCCRCPINFVAFMFKQSCCASIRHEAVSFHFGTLCRLVTSLSSKRDWVCRARDIRAEYDCFAVENCEKWRALHGLDHSLRVRLERHYARRVSEGCFMFELAFADSDVPCLRSRFTHFAIRTSRVCWCSSTSTEAITPHEAWVSLPRERTFLCLAQSLAHKSETARLGRSMRPYCGMAGKICRQDRPEREGRGRSGKPGAGLAQLLDVDVFQISDFK